MNKQKVLKEVKPLVEQLQKLSGKKVLFEDKEMLKESTDLADLLQLKNFLNKFLQKRLNTILKGLKSSGFKQTRELSPEITAKLLAYSLKLADDIIDPYDWLQSILEGSVKGLEKYFDDTEVE